MKLQKGFLIVIEGIDGAGKTVVANYLNERLRLQGIDSLVSGESQGTPFAAQVMDLFRSDVAKNVTSSARILLMNSARSDVYTNVTKPALDANKIVIYDRFLLTTKMYNHDAIDEINALHEISTDGAVPDLTIVLDVPVDRALCRIHARGSAKDYLESASVDVIEKRRSIMLDWYMKNSDVCELVSADAPIGEVVDRVLNAVLRKIQPSLVYKT